MPGWDRIVFTTAIAVVLTACASSRPSVSTSVPTRLSPANSASAAPATSAPAASPTFSADPLTCGTVVDPGSANGGYFTGSNITAERVIAYLELFELHGIPQVDSGNLTTSELNVLWGASQDLEHYTGNRLAGDAEQYAQDQENYSNINGPVDPSYASALLSDITSLVKDCPGATKIALQIGN